MLMDYDTTDMKFVLPQCLVDNSAWVKDTWAPFEKDCIFCQSIIKFLTITCCFGLSFLAEAALSFLDSEIILKGGNIL